MLAPLFTLAASAFVAPSPRGMPLPRTAVSPLTAAPLMSERWQDSPILVRIAFYSFCPNTSHTAPLFSRPQDEATPDRVFDMKTGYKGRVPWGFSNEAEIINGRFAMMGFTIAYLQEAIGGKGVLEQYGFGYDEGAVLMPTPPGAFVLPGVIALFFALILTTGFSLAGVKAIQALGMEQGNYLEKNGDKLKSLPLVGGFF